MADAIDMECQLADVARLAAILERHLSSVGQDFGLRDLETPEGRQEILDCVDQAWTLAGVIRERATQPKVA